MTDTPKCISSSRIASNHDKSIDFDYFTGKNDHYKSVRTQRKCLILTDTQCRSLILNIQNAYFIEITMNTAHEKFQKCYIFSENMLKMVSMCHTSGVQTVYVCFGTISKFETCLLRNSNSQILVKILPKKQFFHDF